MQAKRLWSLWQALVLGIACSFAIAVGRRRFVEWVTGLALNVEEHTVTQSLVEKKPVSLQEKSGVASGFHQGYPDNLR